MINYLRLLRAEQWLKNVFIFAGLVFSVKFASLPSIIGSLTAFVIFCLLSSGGYIINDLIDSNEDRMLASKSNRPIAAGKIPLKTALVIGIILIVVSLVGALLYGGAFFWTAVTYIALSLSYSLVVKHVVILDVLFVSLGYVVRAVAGAVAINVEISPWLILCTFLIALFIILCKRRAEIIMLGDAALQHRKVLFQYSVVLLDKMIVATAAACLVSYCIYTLAPGTVHKFHTQSMIYTIPFVVYGIFRYLYIMEKKIMADVPSRVVIRDLPLLISVVAWGIVCIVILSICSAS